MTGKKNALTSTLESQLQAIFDRIVAIESVATQVRNDVAFVRGYVSTLGTMEGTMSAVAGKLNSIHNTLLGSMGGRAEKIGLPKPEASGFQELGRMSLEEFLSKFGPRKGDGKTGSETSDVGHDKGSASAQREPSQAEGRGSPTHSSGKAGSKKGSSDRG